MAAARLGLVDLGPDDRALELTAQRLEQVAEACRPDRESFVNPAKALALELAGSLPMIWGAGEVAGVAATRMACQLEENAKYPAIAGVLPEAHHNQVVAFDGPLAAAGSHDDFFRDRVDDESTMQLRLVLLHDDDGSEAMRQRVEVSAEVASARGVAVSTLRSEGASGVERLASLVGLIDYASVYLALALGVDPTPIQPIDDLKARLR
jgi:glucose/mannose-6-phosphate isomerase